MFSRRDESASFGWSLDSPASRSLRMRDCKLRTQGTGQILNSCSIQLHRTPPHYVCLFRNAHRLIIAMRRWSGGTSIICLTCPVNGVVIAPSVACPTSFRCRKTDSIWVFMRKVKDAYDRRSSMKVRLSRHFLTGLGKRNDANDKLAMQ